MTEIPDEIREAGVAWVAEQTKHYSTESNLKAMACHDLMAGWIACYKFLTSGKPDGYKYQGSDGWLFSVDRIEVTHPSWQVIPVRLLKCEAADEQ